MRYAVHSLHAKAVEVGDDGSYTLNGNDRIRLGEALFVGESADEAERWRANMMEQRSAAIARIIAGDSELLVDDKA